MKNNWSQIVHPIVHLNGSGGDALQKQFRECADAVLAAIETLQKYTPHDRDYYPLGALAGPKAREQWAERVLALRSVFLDLQCLEHGITQLTRYTPDKDLDHAGKPL